MTEVAYRTFSVNGLPTFYREAGPPDAPTLLLLHGFPSSSRMYQPLLTRLADAYRLVAPDFIGFGHSAAPAPTSFAYTFEPCLSGCHPYPLPVECGDWGSFADDDGHGRFGAG